MAHSVYRTPDPLCTKLLLLYCISTWR